MGLRLGIDTGGTYTDAVLVDAASRVRASAKALTTHADLAEGIGEALAAVLADADEPIVLVSLSTTLATNALVEGHGGPVALLLPGQPRSFLERADLGQALAGDPVEFLAGGHDGAGVERAPLDLDAARGAIERHAPKVSAFAVSALFATRNPAHERRLRHLIAELTDRPVSCGHELSAALDAPRRALTALLNARLVSLLADLIAAVRGWMDHYDLHAPLMVVRGDGSLMRADFATASPVETILSGPAASLVGARVLAGEADAVVLDIGGTTSDIGVLTGGEPARNLDGAVIGGWRTRVRAVEVHTHGIGGDSAVRVDGPEPLRLGPDRVVPLSLLAHRFPRLEAMLAAQAEERPLREHAGWFALRRRNPVGGADSLSSSQRLLWQRLDDGAPCALVDLFADQTRLRALRRLVERGLVTLAGFTPSDAVHVLGEHRAWSQPAARAGAMIWARFARERLGRDAGDAEALAAAVRRAMGENTARAVLASVLSDTVLAAGGELSGQARTVIDRSLGAMPGHRLVEFSVRLRLPLIALGAPAATYGPAVAENLATRLVLPPHADVANAVGAVAAGVVQQAVATITPLPDERYRAHAPDGVATLATLDEARAWAAAAAERLARARAEAAGAQAVEVDIDRHETIGHSDTGDSVFFEGTVTATARGRPRLGGESA